MSLLFVIHEGLANNAAFHGEKKTVSTNGVSTWLTLWNHTDARKGQRPRKKFPKLSPDFKYSLLGKMTLSYYRNSTSASPCTKLSSKAWVQQRWQSQVNSKGLFPCGRVNNPAWTCNFRSWEFELPHIHKHKSFEKNNYKYKEGCGNDLLLKTVLKHTHSWVPWVFKEWPSPCHCSLHTEELL